jgi:hypothetical protein
VSLVRDGFDLHSELAGAVAIAAVRLALPGDWSPDEAYF